MFLIQDTIVIDVKNEAQLTSCLQTLCINVNIQRKIQLLFSNRYSLNISVIRYLDFIKKYVESIMLFYSSLHLIIIDVDTYVILNVTRNLIGSCGTRRRNPRDPDFKTYPQSTKLLFPA